MKRARQPEQKAERRDSLLQAAAECFVELNHQLPSAAQVAKRAGVAKGTVYVYFRSKEEMYLSLFMSHLSELLAPFDEFSADQSAGAQLAHRVLSVAEKEPAFLPLAAMLQAILEANVQPEVLYDFKTELSQRLKAAGEQLDERFQWPEGTSEQRLIHSYGGMVGLWQILQWPLALESFSEEATFAPLRRSFDEEVAALFARLWD